MSILRIKNEKGEWVEIPALKGSKGDSGVYVGSGDMPEGYNVQIDPEGDNSLEDEYIDYIEEIIIDELAKRGQLKPEFANSIEELKESGDTSKLYVLPDGNIYAWMLDINKENIVTKELNFGELSAVNYVDKTDGTITEGSESDSKSYLVSDYISASSNTKYTFDMSTVVDSVGTGINGGIMEFKEDYSFIKYTELANLATDILSGSLTTSNNTCHIRIRIYSNDSNTNRNSIKENLKITYETYETNEISYQWTNTGHAFVPADYEDRIIDLEEHLEELENEITNIKSSESIENYVIDEANRVIDKVLDAQGLRTFNIIAMTDLHNNGGESDTEIIHACQGAGYIADRVKIDTFVNLGDHTDNFAHSSWADGQADMEMINNYFHKYLQNVDELRLIGNHDFKEPYSPRVYKLISAFSKNVKWGNMLGGYFYKDYEDYKLRVICMNTSEVTQESIEAGKNATPPYVPTIEITDAQYNWFIQTLDLSSKSDASEWQILIMSHVPLDYYGFKIPYILQAYLKGTIWTDENVTCNFANKNKAGIIANIHGHIHNFKVEKLHLGGPKGAEQIDVYRIAIPEVTESYQNHYVDIPSYIQDVSYPKVTNTAQDTSLNVLCIDLDNHSIKAINYGAGADRTINYPVHEVEDTNIISSYEVDIASVGYTDNARWSIEDGITEKPATGFTAIKLITFERASGQIATIKLEGITWKNDSNTAILMYQDGVYDSAMYLEKAHDYTSDSGFKSIDNGDGTMTIIVGDSPLGKLYDGFKLVGLGSGADARIHITITE